MDVTRVGYCRGENAVTTEPQTTELEVGEVAGYFCEVEAVGGCFWPDCQCKPQVTKPVPSDLAAMRDASQMMRRGKAVFCADLLSAAAFEIEWLRASEKQWLDSTSYKGWDA